MGGRRCGRAARGRVDVLDRLSGGDPLTHTTVPAVALLGGLMITDEFTPDADIARVLGTAAGLLGSSGLLVAGSP
jgi:hypothetical protein